MSKELLVFSAAWCQGCVSLKKMLNGANVKYTEIDIDKEPEKAQEYGIRSLPTSVIVDKELDVEHGIFIGANKFNEIVKGME